MRRWLIFGWLAVVCLVSGVGAGAREPEALGASTQMLVVTTADWNADTGTLQAYERAGARKRWKKVGAAIPVAVGKNGLGWGAGAAAIPGIGGGAGPVDLGPVKKEGDGKAPAGLFRLGTAFGDAAQEPAGWKMPYLALTPTVECVDDPKSKFYNQLVDRAAVTPDWTSSEHMREAGEYYQWGLVVEHNADPATPGAGSCIFMHFWGAPGRATVGCTAMAMDRLEELLAWLGPARKPLLAQMPVGNYKKLRRSWKLPRAAR